MTAHTPESRRRRSIRLKGYDYAQAGAYFVTICTQDRACLFGEVVEGEMRLNDAGQMIAKWWTELNRKYACVETDASVVMPNHFHGIIVITHPVGADLRVCPDPNVGAHADALSGAHADALSGAHADALSGAHAGAPLPEIVQWFKTMTTNEYMRRVKNDGWPPFRGRLWQRNYYEHIIRDDGSLDRIRQYILDNPVRWAFDRENPVAAATESEEAWEN
ncbi:MAG: hypothetical protein GX446_09050 [Chthonomonadales bacterium]|nr:hypothetical protein [Chthonomonadales bacterium]